MNTALNIRDVGPEIKAALAQRSEAEGKPMAEIVKAILSEALGVGDEHPADRWKRANKNAIAAYNARSETVLKQVQSLSVASVPQFTEDR